MGSGSGSPDPTLLDIARAYTERWLPGAPARAPDSVLVGWDEAYCRRVADWYDRSPTAYDDRRYARFTRETLRQYQTIVDAGYAVLPWQRPGVPYRDSTELCTAVRATRRVYVYLTRDGHGDGPPVGFHPLREPSGVVVDGVALAYNDVFRAVHDVFGHVMYGNGFSAAGEFRAAYGHMRMYSEAVHPVVFTEQVAQICWYFFGPHLDRGAPRRYPDQKVLDCPPPLLADFKAMFGEGVGDGR